MQLFMFDCKPFTFMKFVKIYEIKNFEKTQKKLYSLFLYIFSLLLRVNQVFILKTEGKASVLIQNMMNILPSYKKNPKEGVYDGTWDSYCSLVSWDDFKKNYADYIDKAGVKRENTYKYNIKKRIE